MRDRICRFIAAVAVAGSLAFAGGAEAASIEGQSQGQERAGEPMSVGQKATKEAAAEVNGFGVRLFVHLSGPETLDNVLISPLSLVMALQMTAAGARGATEAEFRQVLDLGDKPMRRASEDMGGLARQILTQDPALTFRLANGIWVSPDTRLRDDFMTAQRADFSAEIATLDLGSPEAVRTINDWFAAHTQGLISEMLSDLPPDTRLVLANALYFKGRWQDPFDPALTVPQIFLTGGLRDGFPAPQLPMMHANNRSFRYRETEAFQAVILPFAGRAFEAVVVLPKSDAVTWLKAQDAAAWRDILGGAGFDRRLGDLALPRLDFASAPKLALALAAVGVKDAFSRKADFSGMAAGPIWLGRVAHQAVLKLAEEGAEAAAVTSVAMASGRPSAEPPQPFHMVVDRPFLIVLRHIETGTLVLLGLINDPRGHPLQR